MTSLAELAAASRHYAALERRLFEVLGGWVPSTPEPEVKLLLRVHSFQHAWHAELWDELAPRTGPVGGGPRGVDAELVSVVDAMAGSQPSVQRLSAAYRVALPRLVQTYRGVLAAAAPASDGPLVRAVGLMVADDDLEIVAGQSLLNRLVGTTNDEGQKWMLDGIEEHAEQQQPLRRVKPSGGG